MADGYPDHGGTAGRRVAKASGAARRVRPRMTLTQLFVVSFGGLMLVGLVSVLVLSSTAAERNTFNLLNRNAVLLMRALHTDVVETLEPSLEVAGVLSRFYAAGRFGLRPGNERRAIFEGILAGATHMDAIVTYPLEGTPSGIARAPDGGFLELDGGSAITDEALARLETVGPDDPPTWGEPVYVRGDTYVNVVAPLVREGLDGWVVIAVGTDEISRIVARLVEGHSAIAFVLYGEDGALARSDGGIAPRGADPRSAARPVVPLRELEDEVLARFPDRAPIPGFAEASEEGVEVWRLDAAGDLFMIVTRKIDDFGPEAWTAGIYHPISDFREVVRRLGLSILAGVAILVLTLLAIVLVSRKISRVLRRTSEAAGHIAELEFDAVEPLPGSFIREIDREARAFNAMRRGLSDFARYVPRELVERLLKEGSDDPMRSRHRDATVMFTDIVGFTSLSESLPADEVAALLNRHFGCVVRCVSAEGGIVDKYLGDGVMAFWTDGREEHAAPAVRAAIAIAREVAVEARAAREAGHPPLRLRIGLHAGEVIAGNVGPPDRVNFTIIGDTVNVASRLEHLGHDVARDADCVILASDTVVDPLGEEVARTRIGSVHLRNREAPLDVWRIHPEPPTPSEEDAGEGACRVYETKETVPPA